MPPAQNKAAIFSPRFFSFLVVQFLGAANDNAFKVTLTLYVLATITDEAAQVRFTSLATFLFPLPFLIFSPLAGFLADRFSKGRMIFVTKAPEVLAMVLATAAFAAESLPLLLLVLFFMATQSTFFSPPKYGLLPETLEPRDLSLGNGILNMTTNLAILVGSVTGVVLFSRFRSDLEIAGWIFITTALAGTAAALYVPGTPPGNRGSRPNWNPFTTIRAEWKTARGIPVLFQTLFGIAYFSFLGALFLTVIPVYGKNALGLSEEGSGWLLAPLSVGIALGSLLAGWLSQGRVELGLVPLGSFGLTLFSLDMALFGERVARAAGGVPLRVGIDLLLLGVSAGLFIVPLYALLQQRSPEGHKGRLIAFSNVLSFSAVMLAAAFPWLLTDLLGWSSGRIVLAASVLTLLVTLYILNLLPHFLVRLVLWLLTNTIYRIRVVGEKNLPSGGGLLVANHMSWVDAMLVAAASDRMVRFLMFRPFYEATLLNWFLRRMRVIPIAGGDPPELRDASLAKAREEIARGHLVCIFAEGSISRTGNLLKFKRGFEHIAEGMHGPIVPVFLDGIWGSIFSYARGKIRLRFPRRIFEPVRVLFGTPMPATSKAFEVRQRIQEISAEAFDLRKSRQHTLQAVFLQSAKRHWRRPFVFEAHGRPLRFGQTLVRALALRRRLVEAGDVSSGVGILLPRGVDAALANLSVLAAGRPVANLDMEADGATLRGQIERSRVERIITSKAVMQARGEALEGLRLIDIEQATASLSRVRMAGLWLAARFLPLPAARSALLGGPQREVNRPAALICSALEKTDGLDHVVVLSHHNILSNIASLRQVFQIVREDRILGVLPLSVSMGLTGTLLLPAVAGVAAVYHRDATDVESVARLLEECRVTLVPMAPAHLTAYTRVMPDRAFRDVRHVFTSGAGLTDTARSDFERKFGVEPLEGFGCPECSPVISLNFPTRVDDPRGQTGTRADSSGQPLPGVAVKIVGPESGETLPPDRDGRLHVKGSNVMLGYLDDPEATSRVLRDGWFHTGLTARQDTDGFLHISRSGSRPGEGPPGDGTKPPRS